MTKLADIKAGDMVIANGTHLCLMPGEICRVSEDNGVRRLMYVRCYCPTRHYLYADGEGNLVGFHKMREPVR